MNCQEKFYLICITQRTLRIGGDNYQQKTAQKECRLGITKAKHKNQRTLRIGGDNY